MREQGVILHGDHDLLGGFIDRVKRHRYLPVREMWRVLLQD
jgi:hypothetical protein